MRRSRLVFLPPLLFIRIRYWFFYSCCCFFYHLLILFLFLLCERARRRLNRLNRVRRHGVFLFTARRFHAQWLLSLMMMFRREIIRGRRGSRARRIIISSCFQTTTFRLLRQKEWVVFSSYSSSFSSFFCDDVVFRGECVHEGMMRWSDERHFRCSCVVVVLCARAFSFYPFLFFGVKISDALKKNTRGGWEEEIWVSSLFYFFVWKSAEKRISFNKQNQNIFSLSTSERRRKSGGNLSNRHKKEAVLQRLRRNNKNSVCVCVHSSHLILQ